MKASNAILYDVTIACPISGQKTNQTITVSDGVIRMIKPTHHQFLEGAMPEHGVFHLRDATVIPGLIDTHCHFTSTGMLAITADLCSCLSIDDVLTALQEYQRAQIIEDWILGSRFDDYLIREKRAPSISELDKLFPGRPVLLEHRSYHFGVVNSIGLARLPSKVTGIEVDSSGKPTGVVRDQALRLFRAMVQSSLNDEQRLSVLRAGAQDAISSGITSIHAIEGDDISGHEHIAFIQGTLNRLPIRVNLIWVTTNVDAARRMGLKSVGADVAIDGTIGSHTAALSFPYSDRQDTLGQLYKLQFEVDRFYKEASSAGLQASVHAIGDRAIDIALKGIGNAKKAMNSAARLFRIDHFGLPTLGQVEMAAQMKVVIATQPPFPFLRGQPGGVYETRIGSSRIQRAYPLREMLDAGLLVAGGSDSPVVPISGIRGLHACVNNPFPAQQLTVTEALQLYTINGAKLSSSEESLGSIEIGKMGDLVVLDGNPLASPPMRIKDFRVLLTLVQGEVVYSSPNLRDHLVSF